MKTNPFITARNSAQCKTVGDAIRLLVDCFSNEGSGDTLGTYILEEAAKEALKRQPARKAEFDEIMARVEASRAKEAATKA